MVALQKMSSWFWFWYDIVPPTPGRYTSAKRRNIFINDFYFANKRYSKQSIFWLLFKKNRQICITLEQDDSDRLWTILILLIKSQNVMDFWLVVLFLQGPRLFLRASSSLFHLIGSFYLLDVGIILSNVILGYALLSNVYLNNVIISIYLQRYRF